MDIIQKLEHEIFLLIKAENFKLDVSKVDGVDFQSSYALKNTGNSKISPVTLAENLSLKLQDLVASNICSKVWYSVPGFINFQLHDSYLIQNLNSVKLVAAVESEEEVIVEFSNPNIAKKFSVGNLRSTIIGDAIAKIYKACGKKVIKLNYLGDWGTQFGRLLVMVDKYKEEEIKSLSVSELEKLYVTYSETYSSDNALAREYFSTLEKGDKELLKKFNIIREVSLLEFLELYKTLNVSFDLTTGEMEASTYATQVLEDLHNLGLVSLSNGALIVEFEDLDTPGIILKSDGSTTYLLRDLASMKLRKLKFPNCKKICYETGEEQSLHFNQLFRVAHKLGYYDMKNLTHITHGLIRLPEGKMSTRTGNSIKVDELLAKLIEGSSKVTENPEIYNKVAMGALKYYDLKRSPSLNYAFDWLEALNLQGNSASYIQYAYARCKSIVTKVTLEEKSMNTSDYQLNLYERSLALKILAFESALFSSAENNNPSILCNYLYELANTFNLFYANCKILGSEPYTQELRIELVSKCASNLEFGLGLLGIECPEKM